MNALRDPNVRRWLYGTTGAALTVAGVYGYLDGQQTAAWMGFAAAALGLAVVKTPTPPGNDGAGE